MKEILQKIIDRTSSLGLAKSDIANANDFLKNREYGLCFDTLVTQLYESQIGIDEGFYELLSKAAAQMKMPLSAFDFIKELLPSSK